MPKVESELFTTLNDEIGCQKLGHPVPDSYLVFESYRHSASVLTTFATRAIPSLFPAAEKFSIGTPMLEAIAAHGTVLIQM